MLKAGLTLHFVWYSVGNVLYRRSLETLAEEYVCTFDSVQTSDHRCTVAMFRNDEQWRRWEWMGCRGWEWRDQQWVVDRTLVARQLQPPALLGKPPRRRRVARGRRTHSKFASHPERTNKLVKDATLAARVVDFLEP